MAITSNPIPANTRIATVSNDSDQFPISQGATFNDQKITSKALFLQADRAEIAGKIPKISTPTAGNLPTVTSDGSLIDSGTSLSALSLTVSGNSTAITALQTFTADHESRLDSTELTLARQSQDLASVKQTLQQGNGATLDFSGIGSVALDARATGRANPTVEGLTATNLISNPDGSSGVTSGLGVLGGIVSIEGSSFKFTENLATSEHFTDIALPTPIVGHKYIFFVTYKEKTDGLNYCAIIYNKKSDGSINQPQGSFVTGTSGVSIGSITIDSLFSTPSFFLRVYAKIGLYTGTGATFKFGKVHVVDLTLINAESWSQEQVLAAFSGILDGTKSIQLPARLRSVGKNLLGSIEYTQNLLGVSMYRGTIIFSIDSFTITSTSADCSTQNWTTSGILTSTARRGLIGTDMLRGRTIYYRRKVAGITSGGTNEYIFFFDASYSIISYSSIGTSNNGVRENSITVPNTARYMSIRHGASDSGQTITYSEFTLSLTPTITLPYEPYQDSTLYIADNEEVRSVPAITDEVKVVNGELVKVRNVQRYVLQESDLEGISFGTTATWFYTFANFLVNGIPLYTDFNGIYVDGWNQISVAGIDNASNIGKFAVGTRINFVFPLGTTITQARTALAGTVIYYQLATPIITPLTTTGILQAKPNGTVYFEPYYEGSHQTDASSEIMLPYEGTIDKLTGYDENLEPYEVPSTGYTLVGTTLTVTGATENEVYYVELSRSEPLAPEMGVNVINNEQVTLDTVNGKYYKITHTTANGVPTTVATEVL